MKYVYDGIEQAHCTEFADCSMTLRYINGEWLATITRGDWSQVRKTFPNMATPAAKLAAWEWANGEIIK